MVTTHEAPGSTRARGPRLARVILWILLALILLLALGLIGARAYLAASVAQYAGEVSVQGLDHPVEILFDEKGIPQIWAGTDRDAYFAIGWLHASERLFQMELLRRTSSGTLAELFGERAFQTDVRQRRTGFHLIGERVLAETDARSRAAMEAYAAGINAWVDQARILPPEFAILRTRPRAWTPLDVATAFTYQSWYPTELADRGGTLALLAERLGPEAAELLTVPREWMQPSAPPAGIAGLLDPDHFPLRMTEATNNWAVAPERSAAGRALHAADPHLAIHGIPGFWYIVGVHSAEGLRALGVTTPGVPVIAMGHNGRAAWSFSVAPLLLTSHYAESFDPQDSLRVRTPDGFATMLARTEEIAIKGEAEPRRVVVYETPRGVVVERRGDVGTSMRWSGHDLFGGDALTAGLEIPLVADFDEFRATVERLPAFSVNWTYSDAGGTIGYQLGPAIPNRSYEPGLVQDATAADVTWDGYHPPDLRPSARNPEPGWVATTNNPPGPHDWPVTIHGNYNLLRMERVAAWFDAHPAADPALMRRMQLDLVSGRALQLRDLAARGASMMGDEDLARVLTAWDGAMAPDDTLATIFAYWSQTMTRHLFEDTLGPDWRAAGGLRDIVLVENLTRFIVDTRTPVNETAEDISARAMRDAVALARGRPFGEVQTLTITHPLSRAPVVDRILRLNRGPFPRGGDSESLNLTGAAYLHAEERFEARVAPSMRFVMDWANVDRFSITIPLGQSGNPFSRHYDDFWPLFETNEPWLVPFSRGGVERRAVSLLTLLPAD